MLKLDERNYLRELAKQVKDISAQPIQQVRIQRWKNLNSLKKGRPLIHLFLQNQVIDMVVPESSLKIQDSRFRGIERFLLTKLFKSEHFNDDEPITTTVYIGLDQNVTDWMDGYKHVVMTGDGKATNFEPCITKFSDISKMRMPELSINRETSKLNYETVKELLGDILDIKQGSPFRSSIGWGESMIDQLVEMRGLENVYTDLIDNPGFIHELMDFMTQGHIRLIDQYEKEGAMFLNNNDSYLGSSSFGYTDELPVKDYKEGCLTAKNLWGFAQAQEFSDVSPEMLEEFVLPYQAKIMGRFGLNAYGCCEPLDRKFKVIKKYIPNIRMFSVNPFTNHEIAAEEIKGDYVYCWKPNATALVTYDEKIIAEELERVFKITKDCCVSVMLGDVIEFNGEIRRLERWVEIAKEKAEKYE